MDAMYGFSLDTSVMPFDDGVATGLEVGGTFHVECWTKDGKLRWRDTAKNIVPNVVLNDILNVYYAVGSQTSAFCVGMVDNAGFSAFAAGDTMASHSGWVENTACSNANRPTWSPGAASAQSIVNSSAAVFNMTPPSGATIKGFFLASNNTLGGTSGNLAATAALSSVQPVSNGDTLKVFYTINGSTS